MDRLRGKRCHLRNRFIIIGVAIFGCVHKRNQDFSHTEFTKEDDLFNTNRPSSSVNHEVISFIIVLGKK